MITHFSQKKNNIHSKHQQKKHHLPLLYYSGILLFYQFKVCEICIYIYIIYLRKENDTGSMWLRYVTWCIRIFVFCFFNKDLAVQRGSVWDQKAWREVTVSLPSSRWNDVAGIPKKTVWSSSVKSTWLVFWFSYHLLICYGCPNNFHQ